MLEYSLIQRSPTPVQRPPPLTTRATRSFTVTLVDEWPRAMVMRGRRSKGEPLLRAVRPRVRHPRHARPVAAHLPHPHLQRQQAGAPPSAAAVPASCFHIEKCAGPCVGEVGRDEYDEMVEEFIKFLEGDTDEVVEASPGPGCREAVGEPRVRDGRPPTGTASRASARPSRSSRWSAPASEDFDSSALQDDDLEAAVQVFFVRKGRVMGRKGMGGGQGRAARHRRTRRRRSSRSCTTRTTRSATPRPVVRAGPTRRGRRARGVA